MPVLPALFGGAVIGVMEVVLATSFAALIFAGPLRAHLPAGIGLVLFGATALLTVVAWRSSLAGTISLPQDVPAVVLSVMAAAIAARLPGGAETFLTVVLALSVTTLLTGVLFLALGAFRLGDLVRFVPYPVIAGFLAGTGWLLTVGAFGVLVDMPVTWGTMGPLLSAPVAVKWLPAMFFAVVLLLLARRLSHPLLIPAALVVAVAIFYAAVWLGGWTVADAETGGWLLGPLPQGALWRPWTLEAVTAADWSAVIAQVGSIGTLLLLATLALLLNSTGVELALRADADLNRELRVTGSANVLAALGGGLAGYHALSLTVLADRMRAGRRLTGLVAAATCGAALVMGSSVLGFVPRAVLGGLLAFIGLGLLVEWAWETARRLPRLEHVVVLVILAVMAVSGFMLGVAVGMALAIGLFVGAYSRTPVVKHALTGTTFRSNVDRSSSQHALLREHGDELLVLELVGFLFFGTANALLEQIVDRLEDTDRPPLRFLVLDLRRVTGMDSSAVLSLAKIHRRLRDAGAVMVLTTVPAPLRPRLERGGLLAGEDLRYAVDLDRGVQWCEDRLLGEHAEAEGDAAGPTSLLSALVAREGEFDIERFRGYLEPVEVAAGDVVIQEGEDSDGLYFLARGRLTVELACDGPAPIRLRELAPGTVVGELSQYLGIRRTASVVATAPSTLYRLDASAFGVMEARDPRLAAALHRLFARLLAQRLVDTQQTIKALRD